MEENPQAKSYINPMKDGFLPPVLYSGFLCDLLEREGMTLCSCPEDAGYTFNWYDSIDSAVAPLPYVPAQKKIHLCDVSICADFLEDHENHYAIVATETATLPEDLTPYMSRIIHVLLQDNITNDTIRFALQHIFLDALVWENQLNHIARTEGSDEALLALGSSMMDLFILEVGIDFDIMRHSTISNYPDANYRRMIEDEKKLDASFASIIFNVGNVYNQPNTDAHLIDEWGHTCLVQPMFYQSTYFGALVAICPSGEQASDGLKHLFAHFTQYMNILRNSYWSKNVTSDLPHFFFFASLIRGEQCSQKTAETTLRRLGIPRSSCFKVLVIDLNETKQSAETLIHALSSLNGRKCLGMLYGQYVVAVLYVGQDVKQLSHTRTLEEFRTRVYEQYKVVCGLSQILRDIKDLDIGFTQAKFALTNKELMEIEVELGENQYDICGVPFDMVFPYFLLKGEPIDQRFRDFCFSSSILGSILADDCIEQTNDFIILWYYLCPDANASTVGKRLFMHRNTVRYHLEQIENKYDIDLSERRIRDELVLEYRAYFAELGLDKVREIFNL